jgi:hypothetical protein
MAKQYGEVLKLSVICLSQGNVFSGASPPQSSEDDFSQLRTNPLAKTINIIQILFITISLRH